MEKGIVGIYLAAGSSRRMGENKLALPLGNTTLGSTALQTALDSDLEHLYVVTKEGDTLDWLDSNFFQPLSVKKWTHITSKEAVKGQAHSLKDGLRAAAKIEAEGYMIILADQPFLTKNTINELIFRYKGTVLVSRFEGIPRPPIIFSRDALPELMKLEGDKGARSIIQTGKLKVTMHDFTDAREFFDIDTKEVYEKIKGAGHELWRQIKH